MTISDSIPIQFWDVDDETFNETDVCGLVKQDCFCQPFQCDDEITIQYLGEAQCELIVVNSSEEILATVEFSETSDGVWSATWIPGSDASPPPCPDLVSLKIRYKGLRNGDFGEGSLAGWSQIGSATAWAYNASQGGCAQVTLTGVIDGVNELSRELRQTYNFEAGLVYTLRYTPSAITFGDTTIVLDVYLNNSLGSFKLPANQSGNTSPSPVAGDRVISFIPSQDYTSIGFIARSTSLRTLRIDNISIDQTELLKSDCIDLRETHDCTVLVEYENTSDFDGINYEAGSPGPSFQLRIPAIFFEEENPQEQEDLELSNGVIVTLRQTILEKRKLEIGYMPNYMHRKLQKVLMHDSVYIDGDYWKKRDAYDTSPVKKYNLKTASVLLTKYDSVEKNTI